MGTHETLIATNPAPGHLTVIFQIRTSSGSIFATVAEVCDMASVDDSSWQSCHDSCQRLHRDVWTLLSERSNLPSTSHRYADITDEIKTKAAQLSKGINRLTDDDLRHKGRKGQTLTSGESARREGLTSVLKSQQIQLNNILNQSHQSAAGRIDEEHRRQLLAQDGGSELGGGGGGGWGATGGYGAIGGHGATYADESQPSLTQKQMLLEQDKGLDSLHDIVVRQRAIAENIETEVGVQNEIIDGLGDEMDQTNAHLLATTRRVQSVSSSSGKIWKYWAIIVLLLVVIIILVAI